MSLANEQQVILQTSVEFELDTNRHYKMFYDIKAEKVNWNIMVSGIDGEYMSFNDYFFGVFESLKKSGKKGSINQEMINIFDRQILIMSSSSIGVPEISKKILFPNGGTYFGQSLYCLLFIDNVLVCFDLMNEREGRRYNMELIKEIAKNTFIKTVSSYMETKSKLQAQKNDKKRKAKKAKKTAGRTEQQLRQDEARSMGDEDINQAVKHLECEEMFAVAHPCFDYDCDVSLDIVEVAFIRVFPVEAGTEVIYYNKDLSYNGLRTAVIKEEDENGKKLITVI
jgi:hypothetical protein